MESEPLPRKLAAILYADVAGYSRLTGEDEDATHRRLSEYLDQIATTIERHGGRVMHYAGDAVLAMFEAVVDTLSCAAQLQLDLKARNADLPDERKVQFRIGVNMGDVIEDRGDIYGDGVNVAARLESLAEPGGICISESVHTAVGNKLPFDYEFMGEQEVKNIAKPVKAYHARLKPDAVLPEPRGVPRKGKQMQRPIVAAVVVLLVILGGVLTWLRPWEPREEPASIERMAFPLPDKPSIAVLPFTNMSDDPKQEYFADGMTDDLITDLSKLSGIFVIARNSTFTYKGKPTKVQQVAEDLGARYVLEGSVRRVADQVRINAQLVDALTGYHLWAERYDGSLGDVFALQDQVIGKIVAALAVKLTSEEAAQAAKAETDVPQAYDAFLRGWEHYRRQTPEDDAKAIAEFEKAIELDPDYGRAYAGLAVVYWHIVLTDWELAAGIEWQHAFDRMKESVEKAKTLEPPPLAYTVSAELLAMWGDYDDAFVEIERAIALDPNSANSYVSKARILNASGRAQEAEEAARLAMRLNPHYRPDYLRVLGRALSHQERYEEAAKIFERAVSWQPDNYLDYDSLASTYGHLGRTEDAKAAVEKYNEIMSEAGYTPLTVHEAGLWWGGDLYDYDKRYVERFVEGLRKAGVRQGVASQIGDADYRVLMSKSAGEYDVEGATKIDVATAKALVDRGVVVVDVRDAGSFGRGHIPGAAHLDLNVDLAEEHLSRLVGKDDEVIFHCWGRYCPYSTYSCAKAVTWGFTRVYYFAGGFPAWQDAGYPVEISADM